MPNLAEKEITQCYFCGEQCTEEDYCYGCKTYICEECDSIRESPWGNHFPEDHEVLLEFQDEEGD